MEKLVTSQFKLGIIAGGQLGKMLALAASNWDIKTYILDKDKNCPASSCCTEFVEGDPQSHDDVYKFGQLVDMITYELEAIDIEALKRLSDEGLPVTPDPQTLETIQDKGLQKAFFAEHAVPSSDFSLINRKNEILEALEQGDIRYPFVQKLRKGGYDGHGVAIVRSADDLSLLLDGACLVEGMVDIAKEISVIVARNNAGEVRCFPTVEMEFNANANLVELLICPSPIGLEKEREARDIAAALIENLGMTGLLAIEMFLDQNGMIWVNEIAPRPHNSGHHTIEGVMTSQYEQLLRAILGFPLGSTQITQPSAMINLLGEPGEEGPVRYEGLSESMREEGVKIHLYGKKICKPFRKMGHVTVLAPTVEEAKVKANKVKQTLKVTACKPQ